MTKKLRACEIDIPSYNLELFTWTRSDGELSCEASDLTAQGGFILRQLYNDAVDVGISIYSPTSGSYQRFSLHEVHRDSLGEDITFWELTPVSGLKTPVKRVVIFND